MSALLAILLGLAAVAVVEAGLYAARFGRERREGELKRRLNAVVPDASENDREALLRRARYARSAALEALLGSIPPARRLEALIQQADSQVSVAQILGWSAGLAGTGLFLAFALGRWVLVLLALAGALAPTLWLLRARARRSRQLSEQLPEALEMMSRSLRAGHALTAGFEIVAREMPAPVSVEFARAFEEQRLGLSFDDAVRRMAERAPLNGDVRIFAISAVIQRETGGNLAEMLDSIARTIRERYRFHAKLRALTAEGRASALVLGALPFLMAFILALVNPAYVALLVTDPMGNVFLAMGLASWAFGQVVLFRMTKVEI
ncbi:MAG TPA: type II secretion system F family protein [Anaeromyxobacteraceae bacterium]|nr:type II secretion system F family protein [Anaeromyxobacteraceae bacterium]